MRVLGQYSNGCVGGIVGSSSTSISNSHNSGNIYGGAKAGGIVGILIGSRTMEIVSCSNTGNVTANVEEGTLHSRWNSRLVVWYKIYNY